MRTNAFVPEDEQAAARQQRAQEQAEYKAVLEAQIKNKKARDERRKSEQLERERPPPSAPARRHRRARRACIWWQPVLSHHLPQQADAVGPGSALFDRRGVRTVENRHRRCGRRTEAEEVGDGVAAAHIYGCASRGRTRHVQGEDAAQRGVQDAQDGNAHETSALTSCEDSRNKGTAAQVIAMAGVP